MQAMTDYHCCGVTMQGIYVAYIGQGPLPTLAELAPEYVQGAIVVRNWDILEPQNGQFNWSSLDQAVNIARQAGKQVMLGVKHGTVGTGLPNWVNFLLFSDSTNVQFPVPWDATFRSEWYGINSWLWYGINSWLVGRYANNPAVSGFVVSGFYSHKFAEMSLSAGMTPQDIQDYIALGYTRQKIQDTAMGLVEQITLRTNKPLRLAYNALLNEQTGTKTVPDTEVYILSPLLTHYSNQIVVGNTTLTPDKPPATSTHAYWKPMRDHPPVFWQVDTIDRGGPYTVEEWQATMNVGLTYSMRWLEVRREDVVRADIAPVLSEWSQAML
jgi:Beta-galactosidase